MVLRTKGWGIIITAATDPSVIAVHSERARENNYSWIQSISLWMSIGCEARCAPCSFFLSSARSGKKTEDEWFLFCGCDINPAWGQFSVISQFNIIKKSANTHACSLRAYWINTVCLIFHGAFHAFASSAVFKFMDFHVCFNVSVQQVTRTMSYQIEICE